MVDPGRYSLTQGVPFQVSPGTSLTLVSVDDSRCPDGVQCIWAGRITYQFELNSCGKTERFGLAPGGASATPSGQALPSHTLASSSGLRVHLATGEPPPRGAASSTPVQRVDIVIEPE